MHIEKFHIIDYASFNNNNRPKNFTDVSFILSLKVNIEVK